MKFILLAASLLISSAAFSWGGRGHDSICRTAVFLVKDKQLRDFLRNKPQLMGHVCNMPDFDWRGINPEISKLGNPTHFIDVEITGAQVKDIPDDYSKVMSEYTGTPNKFKNDGSKIFSVPTEFGSVWWRADQFYRLVSGMKKDFAEATPPANSKEEQNNDLPYNKLVYQMTVDMALMGHFVGDTSQPFHTTADYDGYGTGHGGIHAYFEDGAVGEFDGDLDARVLKTARAMKDPSFLKPDSVVEKMKALSVISTAEVPKILKVDPVIEKSTVVKEHGMDIRTPAKRQDVHVGYEHFEKFIVTDLARGAVLLAALWDESYANAGRPKLTAFKSYKYPFTVEFIAPDYITPTPGADSKAAGTPTASPSASPAASPVK